MKYSPAILGLAALAATENMACDSKKDCGKIEHPQIVSLVPQSDTRRRIFGDNCFTSPGEAFGKIGLFKDDGVRSSTIETVGIEVVDDADLAKHCSQSSKDDTLFFVLSPDSFNRCGNVDSAKPRFNVIKCGDIKTSPSLKSTLTPALKDHRLFTTGWCVTDSSGKEQRL